MNTYHRHLFVAILPTLIGAACQVSDDDNYRRAEYDSPPTTNLPVIGSWFHPGIEVEISTNSLYCNGDSQEVLEIGQKTIQLKYRVEVCNLAPVLFWECLPPYGTLVLMGEGRSTVFYRRM